MLFEVFFSIFANRFNCSVFRRNIEMKSFATQKVSLGEKIGYSVGGAAANRVF